MKARKAAKKAPDTKVILSARIDQGMRDAMQRWADERDLPLSWVAERVLEIGWPTFLENTAKFPEPKPLTALGA